MPAIRRRTNQERRGESQEKILDAAQSLFARRGFNGVSLKEIADRAGVDASLLHYYFTSKDRLFGAVIARHADEVNKARLQALRRYEEEAKGRLTVEGVVRAYLESTFEVILSGGEHYLEYVTVIAQLNSTPAGMTPTVDTTPFDPMVEVFVELLGKAKPNRRHADLYWFYHMLSGAITVTWARTG